MQLKGSGSWVFGSKAWDEPQLSRGRCRVSLASQALNYLYQWLVDRCCWINLGIVYWRNFFKALPCLQVHFSASFAAAETHCCQAPVQDADAVVVAGGSAVVVAVPSVFAGKWFSKLGSGPFPRVP